MMSRPTKYNPSRSSRGRIMRQISRSRGVISALVALPPTCILPRCSSSRGTLSVHPSGSPSSTISRLSPPRLEVRYRLEDCVQVAVAGAREKDAFAAVPVQRFHDHLAALFRHEFLETRDLVGDDRGRNRTGKVERIKFFVRLAEPRRTVQHERAPAVGETQQHRREKVRGVGRRILAHENRVEGLERILRALVEEAVMRRRAHHLASARPCERLMTVREKPAQPQVKNLMPARERLEHEDKSRVLVLEHALERVHYERELQRHGPLLPNPEAKI